MHIGLIGGFRETEIVVPLGESLDKVHDAYMSIAVSGAVSEEQRDTIFRAGKKMCDDQGAQAVVLAGTDLFVAFDGYECGFKYVDSALIHIDAIYRASLQKSDNKAMLATSV